MPTPTSFLPSFPLPFPSLRSLLSASHHPANLQIINCSCATGLSNERFVSTKSNPNSPLSPNFQLNPTSSREGARRNLNVFVELLRFFMRMVWTVGCSSRDPKWTHRGTSAQLFSVICLFSKPPLEGEKGNGGNEGEAPFVLISTFIVCFAKSERMILHLIV